MKEVRSRSEVQRRSIDALFRKCAAPDRRDRVTGWVDHFCWLATVSESHADLQKTRGRTKATNSLLRVAELIKELTKQVDDLPEEAVFALLFKRMRRPEKPLVETWLDARGHTERGLGPSSYEIEPIVNATPVSNDPSLLELRRSFARRTILKRRYYRIHGHVEQLSTLAADAESAARLLEKGLSLPEFPAKRRAREVCEEAASAYADITGKQAGRSGKQDSAFVKFLDAIYELLAIDAKAGGQTKMLTARLRSRERLRLKRLADRQKVDC